MWEVRTIAAMPVAISHSRRKPARRAYRRCVLSVGFSPMPGYTKIRNRGFQGPRLRIFTSLLVCLNIAFAP